MAEAPEPLDSSSVGDESKFRPESELVSALESMSAAPRSSGGVRLLVGRGELGRRETPDRVYLSPEEGFPGDAWGRCLPRRVDTQLQLSVMQFDVGELIANGQPLALFGDNLFLDLDLSSRNLPVGSIVRIGGSVVEVSLMSHDPCRKFLARFGLDAVRFVAEPGRRALNLRGLFMRVIEPGEVIVGDVAEVLSRPAVAG